jgi:glutamate racemase
LAREGGKIGVFDSGVGGLTVLAALRRSLPFVDLLYLGDTARLPYGNKSADTVLRYTERNVAFLAREGVDAVVVACNSASALALPRLECSLPTWGVVLPGARAAARVAGRRVGVIATTGTIASGAYERALLAHRAELEIFTAACPLLVPLVEEGWLDNDITRAVARRYLEPLIAAEIDTLVLGCTHYPLLRNALQEVLDGALGSGRVTLVDSAEEVSRAVAEAWGGAAAGRRQLQPRMRLCVTDRTAELERLAERILGVSPDLELVEIL